MTSLTQTACPVTLIVDRDTVSMVLDDTEAADDAVVRVAVDAIAEAVESECTSRGIAAEVERQYTPTGRRSDEVDPAIWDAVLVDEVDALRAAILAATVEVTEVGASTVCEDSAGAIDASVRVGGREVEVTLLPGEGGADRWSTWGSGLDYWLSDPSALDGCDREPVINAIVDAVSAAARRADLSPR